LTFDRTGASQLRAIHDAERAHLIRFWPSRAHEEFIWTLGPVAKKLPNLRVRRIAPGQPEDEWVYVTVGAWDEAQEDAHGLEFLLQSRSENPLNVELLAMVGYLHSDPRYRLGLGSIVDIGRPWAEGSASDHLFVALPYSYGPTLENCLHPDRHIRFLWLVPITSREADFARSNGLPALEDLLEKSQLDMIDPERPSVV
jgi:hypothetical protein